MYVGLVELRVLTWNLMHGRSVPPAGRAQFGAFAAALAGWPWTVALLQEVPPWWPPALADRLGADIRLVLTSRNFGLALRRAVAVRRPDLIKSNGGGANAILVRDDGIAEHRTLRLRRWPERRWVHAVRLARGVWVANLHVGNGDRAAERDSALAGEAVLGWAADAPAVLGGDFNLHSVPLPGFAPAGGHGVDKVFVAGLRPSSGAEVLERGRLSDHAPVLVPVEM